MNFVIEKFKFCKIFTYLMFQKGYHFRIYPNKIQRDLLFKHFGCVRFIYNWGLNRKIEEYKSIKKAPSCFDLIKEIPKLKDENEWLEEVNSQSLQMALRNLDNAFTRFFKLKNGFPNFKSKKNHWQSFQVPQHYKIEDNKLFLPKFRTRIKIKDHRKLEGKLKTLTVIKTPSEKFFVSITCEIDANIPEKTRIEEKNTIGIDLGITHFAVLSNGEKIENNKYLKRSLEKLKREQRKLSRKQKGSKNRNKQRIKVARVHEKITNQRGDFLHKTSSRLVRDNQTICIEDLVVSNMIKNHRLAQSIADVGWSEFRRQLEYKSEWYGKNLIVIGRFEPSSKLCNVCGKINNELILTDRIWTCDKCGTIHDRDILAAINIKNFGLAKVVGWGSPEVTPVRYESSIEDSEQEADQFIGR